MITFKIANFEDRTGTSDTAGAQTAIEHLFEYASQYFSSIIYSASDISIEIKVDVDPTVQSIANAGYAYSYLWPRWRNTIYSEINLGVDYNGSQPDGTLTYSIGGAVAAIKGYTSASATIIHELTHTLGFGGSRSYSSGAPSTTSPMLEFDSFVSIIDGKPYFNGPIATSVFGASIPLAPLNTPSAIYHVDAKSPGLLTDMMNPYAGATTNPAIPTPTGLSDFDLAILADMGYRLLPTIRSADKTKYFIGLGTQTVAGTTATEVGYMQGFRSDFKLEHHGSDVQASFKGANAGNVTLSGIETLQFQDLKIDTTISAKAAAIPQKALQAIEEMYIAYFNRVPDAEGLAYWIDSYKAGTSLEKIGQSFYEIGVTMSSKTGYSASMSNADFVRIVYKNVLGRTEVDADGLKYWTDGLASGAQTRGTLINTILDAAHSYKSNATYGWVANLLDNKLAVATHLAITQGITYLTPEESYATCASIAAAVTPTDTAAAIRLIGISDPAWA